MTALSGAVLNYTQLLLVRIGVGIGEAGGSPPSHSMISDIFPPTERPPRPMVRASQVPSSPVDIPWDRIIKDAIQLLME